MTKESSSSLPLYPSTPTSRFPSWIRRPLPAGNQLKKTKETLRRHRLNTVCEEAKCPNRLECYSRRTATFLALGKSCTRACGFCSIDFAKEPPLPDASEPLRIARATKDLGLSHVVITMVARDDLSDHGAGHLVKIVEAIRELCKQTTVELLTSDFGGNREALCTVLSARPEIFNYNLETVRRLTPRVRHRATYDRTLDILSYASSREEIPFVKSGLMVGLGETPEEVKTALRDLQSCGCSIVTIGQYLQPTRKKLRVKSFVAEEQFQEYANYGKAIGIPHVYAGSFVRSSYNAKLVKDRAVASSKEERQKR